jgi:mRNA interferase RelE/StbE
VPGTSKIELAASAAKAFSKLDRPTQQRVARQIDLLAHNPRPRGVMKLQGEDDLYRIRAGDYRIIYSIQDRVLIVLVVAIGNRRDIYKR